MTTGPGKISSKQQKHCHSHAYFIIVSEVSPAVVAAGLDSLATVTCAYE